MAERFADIHRNWDEQYITKCVQDKTEIDGKDSETWIILSVLKSGNKQKMMRMFEMSCEEKKVFDNGKIFRAIIHNHELYDFSVFMDFVDYTFKHDIDELKKSVSTVSLTISSLHYGYLEELGLVEKYLYVN